MLITDNFMFLKYVEEFKRAENKIRQGKSIEVSPALSSNLISTLSPSQIPSGTPTSIHTSIPTSDSSSVHTSVSTSVNSSVSTSVSRSVSNQPTPNGFTRTLDELAANPNTDPVSKYPLKFKKAFKTKGRPRKRAKQMASFNKTRLDRVEDGGKQNSKTKKRRKSCTAEILRNMRRKIQVNLMFHRSIKLLI